MSRERIINQTKQLLKVSLMELLADKPLAKITVKELCEKADINRTTYYKYYIDIYDQMDKIENEIIADMLEKLDAITVENVNDRKNRLIVITKILEYIESRREEFTTLLEKSELNFQHKLLSVIGGKIFDKLNAHNQKNAVRYIYIVNGSYGIIREWLKGDIDMDVIALAKELEAYIKQINIYLEIKIQFPESTTIKNIDSN